jgi:isopentenyl diphosphate isomerase/L-lactate dehydrogenase-like FMN-dependent dehydrogenase
MLRFLAVALVLGVSDAARPFLDYPDTGAADVFGSLANDNFNLPPVDDIVGLPDFQYVAEQHMNVSAYTYYRNGAAGEWSYRNNLESFHRLRLRPKVMVDIDNIESTLPTTILGHNYSAPFFIAPCARAGYAADSAEVSLTRGAGAANVLYVVTDFSSVSKAEIQSAKTPGQNLFQQLYIDPSNDTSILEQIRLAEAQGFKALVLTVDSAADGNRHRAARYGVGSADAAYSSITWAKYDWMRNQTSLPIVPKGIQTVEDAIMAVERKLPAIYISNHGGRQVDGSPSPLEVAIEIKKRAPWVFEQIEVWADGGVRYGADVVKLLALGVRAVGIGRPFMFANVYGEAGVSKAIDIMLREVAIDAANAGISDLRNISQAHVDLDNYSRNWGM